MPKKEIKNNKIHLKNIIKTMFVIILMVFFISPNTAVTHCFLDTPGNTSTRTILRPTESAINAKISETIFVDNFTTILNTQYYPRNSIIHINITVLSQSNASVEINYDGDEDYFSPNLTNFILAPGKSFAENYTCKIGTIGGIAYLCHCTLDNSNATIQWWYEVLYLAEMSVFIGVEFLFIGGAFILSTMTLVLITKKKPNKKNE